jgi:steroid delta-isomerase-like uncharacterized protein
MSEENKAVVRREAAEIYSYTGNLDTADEIYAPDFVGHNTSSPEPIRGPEAVKQFAGMYRSVFPDLTSTIEDQIAEGDKVVTRWIARGTHQGELVGIAAPTGNTVEITGMTFSRISSEGKIVEAWYNGDDLGLMQQLGVIPEPGQGGS